MSIRTQLIGYLSKLDQMQLVKGRQALIHYLAFDHLRNKIDWEGTALTFVDGLLTVLAKEGKEELSRFLAFLEQSDFLGLDQREGLNSLCESITALSNEQWELEFLNVIQFPFTKTVSGVIVNVLIGFLNTIDHEFAISNSIRDSNRVLQSLLQKTELALVDKAIGQRPELIETIGSFLNLPEVEEIIRQFYASRLLSNSEQENLNVIRRELRLLLSLHTPLRGDKLSDASKILFDTIIAGCDQALRTAKRQNDLFIIKEKSTFYNFVLTDYTVAIAKNVDFLGARRKFDIESVLDFEEKYRQQVAERHNSIRPPFIDAAKEVPMNKLYVACGIGAGSRSHDKQQQFISINTFRSTIYRTVLLGNPGGGKSTFASKLCYDIATDYKEHPLPGRQVTPILVVLRKYGEKKKTHHYSILKFIEVTAESDYQIPSLPAGAFEYLLRNGRALVIFDGLDELLDTNDRQEISKDVESFCSMYPTVPVLVTSREVGYDQAPLNEEHFRTYHLTSFNEAQVREYVTRWFILVQSLTEEDRQQRIDSFMNESQQVPDLRSNPLMLALMCNIYRGEGYIPENRPDLYEKCADMLFKQWDKGRGITMQIALSPRTRYAMMFLAHWIYTHSALQEGVTESQLIAEATTHLCPRPYEDRDEAQQAACEIIEFCRGRAWVFTDTGTTKTGEKLYQFTHRTFLEFFTAAHLVRTHSTPIELVNLLLPKIAAKEWDVVAQLAFHMLARQTAGAEDTLLTMLLDHLQEMPDQEAWNIISFTARCLAFILPSQVVIRKITITCAEHWLVEQIKQLSNKDARGGNPRPVILIGDLLAAAAAVENRTTIAKTLEQWLTTKINESEESSVYLTAQLSLYLELTLHAGMGNYRPELYRFWREVSNRISNTCSERLKVLGLKYLFICQKILFDGLISVASIVKKYGMKGLFEDISSDVFSFVVFGSIADELLHRGFSLFEKSPKSDMTKVTKSIYQELMPILLKFPPPWTETVRSEYPGLGYRANKKSREIKPLNKHLLNSTVFFGIFCLYATNLESLMARAPNQKEKQLVLQRYASQYNPSVINLLRWIFIAHYQSVERQKVQEVMDECGFTQQQQTFVWRWVHGEIDLVLNTVKQIPLDIDKEDMDELLH